MEDLSVTSVLSLFDTNAEQRKAFADKVVRFVCSGKTPALNVHVQLKCMNDIIKRVLEDKTYKIIVLDEAMKYGSTHFEYQNAGIAIKETGVQYDYSKCNDTVYDELMQSFAHTDKLLREREKFLKALPASGMDVITEDGEAVKIYPPSKSSSTSTVVTLK
jgi:hypothetical protein